MYQGIYNYSPPLIIETFPIGIYRHLTRYNYTIFLKSLQMWENIKITNSITDRFKAI